MSFPTEHPFRPAGPPELLCGGAVIITEQAAQSLTTSHLPVGTAHAFFRFEERVPESLMVALSVIMMGELDSGLWAIVWHSVALSGVVAPGPSLDGDAVVTWGATCAEGMIGQRAGDDRVRRVTVPIESVDAAVVLRKNSIRR